MRSPKPASKSSGAITHAVLSRDRPEKRLIDNLGEIEAIRSHGFGVLSIYQYFNNQPLKFAGKRKVSCQTKKGESSTIEVTLPGPDCRPRPIEDCHEAEGPSIPAWTRLSSTRAQR